MKLKGKVWKFGDHIDTDIIIPAKYLMHTDPKVLSQHCMEPLSPDFPKKVKLRPRFSITGLHGFFQEPIP